MLKLCSVQGGEVKTAKIFDGIFVKGLSFVWEGWRKKTLSEGWIELSLTFKMSFAQEKRRRKKLAFLHNLYQFVTNIYFSK